MKKTILSLCFLSALLLSCVSNPKTGFDKEKLSVCNMLGYSDDILAIEFAKEVWNDTIQVVSLETNEGYILSYDLDNENSFSIYVDPARDGLDYSVELASLVSCVAYIRDNSGDTNLIVDAKAYTNKIYHLIMENILKNNKGVVFENKENFEKYLENLEITNDGKNYMIK